MLKEAVRTSLRERLKSPLSCLLSAGSGSSRDMADAAELWRRDHSAHASDQIVVGVEELEERKLRPPVVPVTSEVTPSTIRRATFGPTRSEPACVPSVSSAFDPVRGVRPYEKGTVLLSGARYPSAMNPERPAPSLALAERSPWLKYSQRR